MRPDRRAPVIVGVGQVSHHANRLDDALSPVQLMAAAARSAAASAGLKAFPQEIDAIRVVQLLSWRYRDPARFVAEELATACRERGYTGGGGNTPQSLLNKTAYEIQRGDVDLVVLCGGEAWRSRNLARRAGVTLWNPVDETVSPDVIHGSDLTISGPEEAAAGVTLPIQMYPLIETAIRAKNGETPELHRQRIGALWSRFAMVAAANPYAWNRSGPSAEEITVASPTNRMIGAPYTKLMNSNNDVNQAAAVLMCSVERAELLGVPRDRWVFIHAGTDSHEHLLVSHRDEITQTPAIELGGRMALDLAGVGIDDVEIIDLYSCFPSAVQLGAQSLGLSLDRQLTRTGGLSFAGGPWNNYAMHAIATVVDDLRARERAYGLVWGNGGYVTKHAFGVYSTEPPADGFRYDSPQATIDVLPRRHVVQGSDAGGLATIEGYTVMHDRDGLPQTAHAAVRRADGTRAWGASSRAETAAAMADGEWVGQVVQLSDEGEMLVS